ncbi:glycoside hydrolase family 43 protein [Enterococcus gallinarum]|uniref:glycoside hydrolase family 43 protein n=1 Tax=Enterococcus gallinarum TaxID=1353 RepID=UPI003D6A7164
MSTIINPILPGFNPDPCILRVEDTYYIAVSSFEWLPGIRIYASKDLVNWSHETDILTDQADLKGNPANCSIWAPQISYSEGTFYCVYTNVRNTTRPFKDCHNYLILADDIHGPWSQPIYLNSSGFDPSLFHDRDGKKWLLNEIWDYRYTTPNKSAGIVMQELDLKEQQLSGPIYKLFSGTELAKTEAPHLYFHHGYYYLMTAEGGTGEDHAVTVCRSKEITGPYEIDPNYPLITAKGNTRSPFRCTGHGSLVETPDGKWFMSYLMTRPIEGAAILGRETALHEVYWTKAGWLALSNDQRVPDKAIYIDTVGSQQIQRNDFYDPFTSSLKKEWNARRIMPDSSWCDLSARPGYLRMISGESMQSNFQKHLLAIRQKDFCFTVQTELAFSPKTFNQMAGICLFLNEENYLYHYVTYDETFGTVLRMIRCSKGEFCLLKEIVPLEAGAVALRVTVDHKEAQFYFKQGKDWQKFESKKNILFLAGGFTGNFVGISVQDLDSFKGTFADFNYFQYQPELDV